MKDLANNCCTSAGVVLTILSFDFASPDLITLTITLRGAVITAYLGASA